MTTPKAEQPERQAGDTRENPMAAIISVLLLFGVAISATILAAGLLLLAISGQSGYHETVSPALLLARAGTVPFPRTIGGVLQGALALKPFAIIELGVIVLIATPVFRVAASVILFFLEKDRLYGWLTLAVLGLLLASIFWIGQ